MRSDVRDRAIVPEPGDLVLTIRLDRAAVVDMSQLIQPIIERAVADGLARASEAASHRGMSKETEPLLLTMNQVAKLLGVSAKTVCNRSRAGDMPAARKLGANIRWSRDEIKAWIDAKCPRQHPAV